MFKRGQGYFHVVKILDVFLYRVYKPRNKRKISYENLNTITIRCQMVSSQQYAITLIYWPRHMSLHFGEKNQAIFINNMEI